MSINIKQDILCVCVGVCVWGCVCVCVFNAVCNDEMPTQRAECDDISHTGTQADSCLPIQI